MLRKFVHFLRVSLYLALLTVFVLFFSNNLQRIEIHFLMWSYTLDLAMWTLYATLAGFFLALIFFGGSWLRVNSASNQIKRKIESLQREVDYLRNRPLLEEGESKASGIDSRFSSSYPISPTAARLLEETESA